MSKKENSMRQINILRWLLVGCLLGGVSISDSAAQERPKERSQERKTERLAKEQAREMKRYGMVMPRFQTGGLAQFRKWVELHIQYPQSTHTMRSDVEVVVAFTIDTEGQLGEIEFKQLGDPEMALEVKRVLEISPAWSPGFGVDGKPRPVRYTLPILFRAGNKFSEQETDHNGNRQIQMESSGSRYGISGKKTFR